MFVELLAGFPKSSFLAFTDGVTDMNGRERLCVLCVCVSHIVFPSENYFLQNYFTLGLYSVCILFGIPKKTIDIRSVEACCLSLPMAFAISQVERDGRGSLLKSAE